jgi:hypothetical protein
MVVVGHVVFGGALGLCGDDVDAEVTSLHKSKRRPKEASIEPQG